MNNDWPSWHSCDERPLPGVRAFVRRHDRERTKRDMRELLLRYCVPGSHRG